eukprot:1178685-Prorocentrum_minimum.AAC.4
MEYHKPQGGASSASANLLAFVSRCTLLNDGGLMCEPQSIMAAATTCPTLHCERRVLLSSRTA